MNSALPSRETLAILYRLAVILTGDAHSAEQVMVETFTVGFGQIGQFRNEKHRNAWLVTKIRENCLKKMLTSTAPEKLKDELASEVSQLIAKFHTLPEPGRSSLALFYLDLFTASEIADLLGLNLNQLSESLAHARPLIEKI